MSVKRGRAIDRLAVKMFVSVVGIAFVTAISAWLGPMRTLRIDRESGEK